MTNFNFTNPSFVRQVMREHGFNTKKRLGQNFLIDQNILEKILTAADLNSEDWVLEIGPGLGALTSVAAARVQKVVAIEIDPALTAILQEHLVASNVAIIQSDALKEDWEAILKKVGWQEQPLKLVANLPYYLTTPLIMKGLECSLPFTDLVVMVQKEVAQRMAAGPNSKDYGVLSLVVQYYTEVSVVINVPRTVFFPAPAVDSAVVRLKPRPPQVSAPRQELFEVIRTGFQQRRKTLRNALKPLMTKWGLEREHLEQAFMKTGIDPSLRAERLSLAEFSALTKTLLKGG